MKYCSRCYVGKADSEFYQSRINTFSDILYRWCKPCERERIRQWRLKNPEKEHAKGKRYRLKHPDRCRDHGKRNRQINREKILASAKIYNSLEYVKQRKKLWIEKNRQGVKDSQRRYVQNHKERVIRSKREWDKRNPEVGLEKSLRRAHLKRATASKVPSERIDFQAIAKRDGMRCHLCKKKVTKKTLSFDHLIPLSKGGAHLTINLAVAHRSCNSRRGAGRLPAQLRLIG